MARPTLAAAAASGHSRPQAAFQLTVSWSQAPEVCMPRKLVRTGFAIVALACTSLAGGLPAQAKAAPSIAKGEEIVTSFYSSAQHTTLVGQSYLGSCDPGASWGKFSIYSTQTEFFCNP